MGYKLPNGATVQHASGYASALAFTAGTNATETVLTVTGATLAAGDIVLVSSSWSPLNNKVVRVKAATSSAITLEATDTTNLQNFPAGAGVGTLKKITGWVSVPQVTEFASSGGTQNYTDVAFLEQSQGFQIPTDKAAAAIAITVADDPTQAYNAVLLAADANKQVEAARLNLPGTDMLLYGVYTSYSQQPTVTRNSLLTRVLNLALQSTPTRYLS